MNEMRKLMEAVQLNEFFVKNGMTIGDAYKTLINGPGDWKEEAEYHTEEGWTKAADVANTVARMSIEVRPSIKKNRKVKLPPEVVEDLDHKGNQMFDLGPYEDDESEWIENVGQVALDVMDILTNLADDIARGAYEEEDKEYDRYGGPLSPEGKAYEESVDEEYGGGHATHNAREATVALHQLMDEGMLDARTVADAALNYMSEAEVEDMASDNFFFGESVENEDEALEETEISAEWGQVVGDKLYRREGFEDARNGVYRPEAYGKGSARDSYRAGKEEWVSLMAQER